MNKKRWEQIFVFALAAMLLCACQSKSTSTDSETNKQQGIEKEETNSKYDFTKPSTLKMKNAFEYMPKAKLAGVKDGKFLEVPGTDGYVVMQGACTDGKYVYCVLEKQNAERVGDTMISMDKIFKIDMTTWEIVAETEPLRLGHANSLTYNSKTNQIIVTNYSPDPKEITFVNPDSLAITGNRILEQSITGIAYNAARDQYVLANGATQFSIVDADFNEIAYVAGHQVLGTQDIDCDDNYIYVGNSGVVQNPGVEVVKVYDWDGEYKGIYRVDSVNEQEALFNANGKYYITFFTGNGGRIFEIQYDFDLLNS